MVHTHQQAPPAAIPPVRRPTEGRALTGLVERLQSEGRYTFTRNEARKHLALSPEALKRTTSRLISKGRLLMPHRGFYVIVPVEYSRTGGPPPSWFIADLMAFLDRPYYVGLLSAAALSGAAHHQPQEFQVVTNAALRPMRMGRSRIRFFMKGQVSASAVKDVQTETGTMRVSTPEVTAFDLVRYAKRIGGVSSAAAVLRDLSEAIDPGALAKSAGKENALAVVQRTGYLLSHFGARRVTGPLQTWLANRGSRPVPLRAERGAKRRSLDSEWNIVVNDEVEVDE